MQTPWLLLFYLITVLQGALRLEIQCPPADLIHLTKVTLPVSEPKWAPSSLIPFPALLVPAQSTRWLHSHSLGPQYPMSCLLFNSWEFYQTEVVGHSCSPQGRSTPRRSVSPSHLQEQPCTDAQEASGHRLVCFCSGLGLWTSPPCSVPLFPLCMKTVATNSLVFIFLKSILTRASQIFLKYSPVYLFPFFHFQLTFYTVSLNSI